MDRGAWQAAVHGVVDATERLSHSLNVCMSINECFA